MPSHPGIQLLAPSAITLLYVLAFAAAAACVAGLAFRLRGRIASLRPCGGWRRLLVFGLLQRRVLTRAAGWAHLAVVAGFVGLAIGAGAMAHLPSARAALKTFLDAAGLVFVGGIAALLLTRRRSAGAVTVLVAMLYVGMSGFMLEALRVRLGSADPAGFGGRWLAMFLPLHHGYTLLWWSHVLVVLGMLAALPFCTLLHVVAAPLTMM